MRNGIVKVLRRDQLVNCPLVGGVFVTLPAVKIRITIVKTPGKTVPQFVGKFIAFVCFTGDPLRIYGNKALSVAVHDGQCFSFSQLKVIHHDVVLLCDVVELSERFHFLSFFLSRTKAA